MTAMMQLRFIASLIALSALGLCGPAFAHGDEDHSEPDKPVAANVAVANNTAGTALEAAATQRLPDGSLLVPKAVQRQLGLRTVLAQVYEDRRPRVANQLAGWGDRKSVV